MLTPALRRSVLSSLGLVLLGGAAFAQDATTPCFDRSLGLAIQVAACDEALARTEDPIVQGELLAEQGRAFRLLGNLPLAENAIARAMELIPEDADPWIDQGYLLRDRGDIDAALAATAHALELEPGYPRAILGRMDLLPDAGLNEECLELSVQAVELAPERAHTWALRGRCLAELGRTEEAIADYEKAREIGHEEAYLFDNLSIAYRNMERYDEALDAARHALGLDPEHESARLSLMDALVLTGAVDEAIALYRETEARGIEDTLGRANELGWTLYQSKHYEPALQIMEEWLAAHPEPTAANTYELDTAGHVFAAVGRTDEAVDLFLHAAELGGPESRAFYEGRLAELGFPPEAGEGGLEASLRACAATGTACLISP